jgi:hypothetical protein
MDDYCGKSHAVAIEESKIVEEVEDYDCEFACDLCGQEGCDRDCLSLTKTKSNYPLDSDQAQAL